MIASSRSPSVLELFAGAGGMAVGLHKAGFHHLALLERDPNAVLTLQANATSGAGVQPDKPIKPVDVHGVRYDEFDSEVSLLAAGAPCQPFSLAGNHLGEVDERNLFPEVFRAQRELAPKAVLLENVWGLARPSFRPYLEYLLLQLALPHRTARQHEAWLAHKARLEGAVRKALASQEPSYDVRIAAVECANFGVPQRRNRLFVVALRTDLEVSWRWPEATHSEQALIFAKSLSGAYWREHGVLARHANGVALPSTLSSTNGTQRWRTVRDVLRELPVPDAPNASQPYHPDHYRIDGCREYRGHTGSTMDQPAKTLKAGVHGVPGGENMVRFSNGVLRYFTLHESALFQTFPADYVFRGTRSAVIRQIGNAAPTEVVRLLADRVRRALARASEGRSVGFRAPHVDLIDGKALRQL